MEKVNYKSTSCDMLFKDVVTVATNFKAFRNSAKSKFSVILWGKSIYVCVYILVCKYFSTTVKFFARQLGVNDA